MKNVFRKTSLNSQVRKSSHPEVCCQNVILKNLSKFTKKIFAGVSPKAGDLKLSQTATGGVL